VGVWVALQTTQICGGEGVGGIATISLRGFIVNLCLEYDFWLHYIMWTTFCLRKWCFFNIIKVVPMFYFYQEWIGFNYCEFLFFIELFVTVGSITLK
jgi:hypothetical protein